MSIGETSSYGLAHYVEENCDPSFMFSPSALKFVRPLANPDTSQISLSLYEDTFASLEMSREHYFDQRTWMGTPFRITALAVTGWSNWTISEFPNFEGRTICIRSTQEFSYINSLHSEYPSRAGSVAQGCTVKADATIYLPKQGDHTLQVAISG